VRVEVLAATRVPPLLADGNGLSLVISQTSNAMNLPIATWLFFRLLQWVAWIYFFGFAFYFWLDRAPHLNSFGHLQNATEAKMFIPALVAIFAGFLQMMMRERAGLARPRFGQLIPPRADLPRAELRA